MAMAVSDVSLLDAKSSPLKAYVEGLKPTPEGDLEILLQKRWACPRPWHRGGGGRAGLRWDPLQGERTQVLRDAEPA